MRFRLPGPALLVIALAGAVLPASAQPPSPPAPAEPPIPAHPSKLSYPALTFEVPDAAKYRHELRGGIPVYVAEDHALPLVNLTVTVRVGAFLDPPARPGLASLTGTMMRQGGTQSMTADEFDERAGFLAAEIDSYTGEMSGGASLNCITPVLDDALALLFEMLKAPRFQQDRIDVEKDAVLEEMKQRNDEPAAISGREWGWLLYGREHFSIRELTRDELQAITRDALVEFHRTYWRPAAMLIAVSGDVETREILAKLDKHLAGWNPPGPRVAWPPPPPRHLPAPGLYRVEKDIPQGRVVIGHLGAKRKSWDDPDAFALEVMNDILGGGGFTSRLVKRIRSDEGLAYSAGSSFEVSPYWPGAFSMRYQSKSPTVALAAKIAVEELRRIREQEVSDEELDVSKASFIDVFPRRFESAEDIVDTFVDDEYHGRPHDYWERYRDNIRAVTRQDVLRMARKYLDPDRLVFLVVGKWADIEPGDPDGRASMKQLRDGKSIRLPLRDPLTLEPVE